MWWAELDLFRQILFIIGCATGGILIVQIIMTLVGLGGNSDFDFDGGSDFDGGGSALDSFNDGGAVGMFGMKLLSLRSIIAFFGIGSWMCFLLCDPAIGWYTWAAVLLSVVAGLGAAALMAYALFAIEKLQSSGNVSIENAVGKIGDVYLRIPACKASAGKIQITVQERLREYDALTESESELKRGEKVKVVGVIDDTTLLVEAY